MKPKITCIEKADGITLSNSKAMCGRATSKCKAKWVDEHSEQFVCLALRLSPQKNRLEKIKYTFDLTLSDHIFDALLEHILIRVSDHQLMPPP